MMNRTINTFLCNLLFKNIGMTFFDSQQLDSMNRQIRQDICDVRILELKVTLKLTSIYLMHHIQVE